MIYTIPILSDKEIDNVIDCCYKEKLFINGSVSNNSSLKNNLFFNHKTLIKTMQEYLNPHMQDTASKFLTKKMTQPFITWYKEGMYYDYHIDAFPIAGLNPHYSMSLSLSDPDEYEGGEFVIKIGEIETYHKVPKGHGIIYPTGLWHKVCPVTKGDRKVIIYWLESIICNNQIRNDIIEFGDEIDKLDDQETIEKFEHIRKNMIRCHANNLL